MKDEIQKKSFLGCCTLTTQSLIVGILSFICSVILTPLILFIFWDVSTDDMEKVFKYHGQAVQLYYFLRMFGIAILSWNTLGGIFSVLFFWATIKEARKFVNVYLGFIKINLTMIIILIMSAACTVVDVSSNKMYSLITLGGLIFFGLRYKWEFNVVSKFHNELRIKDQSTKISKTLSLPVKCGSTVVNIAGKS